MAAVGCDLQEIARFERILTRRSFMEEVYTEGERARIRASRRPEQTAAGLWCAKEAAAKALGRGLYGLLPGQLAVSWDESGAPRMSLLGGAAEQYPDARLSVSISHSGGFAMAVVLVE